MSKPAPTRYRTLNWSAYNAALRERGSLTVWFDPGMAWHAAPSGKRGGQAVYSDAAIQACLTIKVLFGLPLRQTTGFVASLLKLAGLDWPAPDHSTLCRRQKTLAVQLPYRGSPGPLNLLVDSTGIKVRGEGEWHARKYGGARRRVWRKVHLAVDERSLEVRAVEGERANAAISATRPFCRTCSVRSPRASRSPLSPPTAPTTPAAATTPSRSGVPRRSSRPAATQSRGREAARPLRAGTRPCEPSDASAGPSGDDGAATTAEAAPRPR